jgi:Family of unknown function (DUF5677)
MYSEQVNRFKSCSTMIANFGRTLTGIEFDETEQAVEIYFLMSIKLAERHTKAISILLQNNLAIETFPLVRNLMESYFKLNWIVGAKENKERIERVYKLEAHPFNKYEHEVEFIGKHLDKDYSFYSKEKYEELVLHIMSEKEEKQQLTTSNKSGELKYLSAPPLPTMMGEIFRVKYYHFYRFVCAYIHPSPFLKTFLLNYNLHEQNPNEIVFKAINQSLGIGLKFMSLLMGYSVDIFEKNNSELHKNRIQQYHKIDLVAKEGYVSYIN